jgi:hypothetical protein
MGHHADGAMADFGFLCGPGLLRQKNDTALLVMLEERGLLRFYQWGDTAA